MTDDLISRVVREVLAKLEQHGAPGLAPTNGHRAPASSEFGVYDDMRAAIDAAHRSFRQLVDAGVSGRRKAIEVIRRLCRDNAEAWGQIEFDETRIGRLTAKVEKLRICADLIPGVEMLERQAYSGDFGLTVIDFAPWGVIGAVTPSTHSVPTLTGNAINMIAAGNAVVFNTHPAAAACAATAIRAYNQAIASAIGITDLLCTVVKPTLDTFDLLCKSDKIPLLCVTGGPAVVKAAMNSGKRAVCAGPGNPPVVVDATADLDRAARSIIQGASYDNNLLCIGEKQVFVVASVADALLAALDRNGAVRLNPGQIEALTKAAFASHNGHLAPNKKFVGQDASVLASAIGLNVPASTALLFGETQDGHPFVEEEQMMPFIPIVRVPDVDTAIAAAIRSEHGYKHTAMMHSVRIDHLTRMAQAVDTTLFIKNGPCMTGLGLGGEGFLSYSIATPTGEGVTTPMTFTRSRRCVMVEHLNLY